MIEYPLLLEKFQTLLKENALKFTKQRELVLKFLYENNGHFTPEDIYTLLKEQHPDVNIGIATVYRTLSLLETSEIASSIKQIKSSPRESTVSPDSSRQVLEIC